MTHLPRPRAVLFDWDDTIVDNWPLALEALNTALVHMGMEAWTDTQARSGAGGSARDIFTRLFGDRWQEADKVFYDTFNKLVEDKIRIHDHVEDILKKLNDHDVYMAVVSNKRGHLLRKEADRIGFTPYFAKIIGAGDAEKDKPNIEHVHKALEGSGIAAGPDVWFIGDSHVDMLCAKNGNMTGILIETKLPPEEALAAAPPACRIKDHRLFMEFINSYFT